MKTLQLPLQSWGHSRHDLGSRRSAVGIFHYPNAPSVVNQEDPQVAGSVVHSSGQLEGGQKAKSINPTLRTNLTSFRGLLLHVAAALVLEQVMQLLLANGRY